MTLVSGINAQDLLAWADAAEKGVLTPGSHQPITTEEAIDVARSNACRSKAFREMSITEWNRVFEYCGWEGLDTMQRTSSVFVRTPSVSPHHLQDCAHYYFQNRTVVLPEMEISPPERRTGNFAESGQSMDLPRVAHSLAMVSQELVNFQQRHAPLHQGIARTALLQADDLPAMITHFFSAEESASPDFQERATRLLHFFERVNNSDIKLSRDDFLSVSRCLRQVNRLLMELALHYSDFQCRSSRLEEVRQVIDSISPEAGEKIKVFLYNILQQSQFQPSFSILDILLHTPSLLRSLSILEHSQLPQIDALARQVLTLLPRLEHDLHPQEYPRWDRWLARLPDVIQHHGLRTLLLQDPAQVPFRKQISSLATEMLRNLTQPYLYSTRSCTDCCNGFHTTLVNLGRLSLLDGQGNRIQVLEQLLQSEKRLSPELSEMIQYQNRQQPFTKTETDELIRTACSHLTTKDIYALTRILTSTPQDIAKQYLLSKRFIQTFINTNAQINSIMTNTLNNLQTMYAGATNLVTNQPIFAITILISIIYWSYILYACAQVYMAGVRASIQQLSHELEILSPVVRLARAVATVFKGTE